MFKLGSLFDGSGTCPLAAHTLGITPVWASEIEPYPVAVTTARFPLMKHLGDITKINGGQIEPVDIVTFGSPCQDLSVAGKQKGIHEGERSNLFFEAIRIIREMREATNGKYPRFAMWENVPGAFSSNGGADFQAVLQAFVTLCGDSRDVPGPPTRGGRAKWQNAGYIVGDGYSIAWRILDAQYWGVPQRRKRIFLVADLAGQCAGKVLFEREGLRGNPAESGETRKGIAGDAQGSTGGSCTAFHLQQDPINGNISPCIGGQHQATVGVVASFMGGQGAKAGGIGYSESISPTIKSVMSGGNTVPDVVYSLRGNNIDRETAQKGKGWGEDCAYTLNSTDRHGVAFAAGFSDALGEKAQGGMGYTEERVPTLRAGDVRSCVYRNCLNPWDQQSSRQYTINGVYETLKAHQGGRCEGIVYQSDIHRKYIIRRLTPLECCRLQGFPDWWEDGVEGSDSARYKMWGNGMAYPCVAYVMEGMLEALTAAWLNTLLEEP